MAQMRILAELGIAHQASLSPNGGYVLAFPNTVVSGQAHMLLASAGYQVNAVGGRGLFAVAPPRPTFNQRHAVAAKRLKVSLLFLILPAFYFSVPVYLFLGVRWYRRLPVASRPSMPRLRMPARRPSHARYI